MLYNSLEVFFKEVRKAALAFSGGTDSALLLHIAKKYNCDIKAYFVKSQFQPQSELEEAQNLALTEKVPLEVINIDVLQKSSVAKNPCNRCYLCKKIIFSEIKKAAKRDGFKIILDGTNADDNPNERPGMKVLEEMKILSPLRLCGLTKEVIRNVSQNLNLPTWNKESYSCLATRIPHGTKITGEILEKIENSESFLFLLGFTGFRVRYFHGACILQFKKGDSQKAFLKREEIMNVLKTWFDKILFEAADRED